MSLCPWGLKSGQTDKEPGEERRDGPNGQRKVGASSRRAGALALALAAAAGSSALLTGVNPDRVPAPTGGRKTL